ncbi:hypothetical protein KMW28_16525 [Flammeovirga yaeyamensis]|uniref:Uncharacterized protein n=1 Tax=Flammeovirga yaeyamensis TaxID=367791 RepID=A0AAX1N1A7_9BACT|nr:hypothetical protein [Flammeovirga yaeyamensis]MBB3698382.1 hypothetical protein [Flammeovirga yaeyamensis]NMF34266.1 hypothetical protein [Flammeovirga yaeyamensis]QWG01249.1 hypothetical protein KMW28_16525 [Flammeovirga yaeyamensis]
MKSKLNKLLILFLPIILFSLAPLNSLFSVRNLDLSSFEEVDKSKYEKTNSLNNKEYCTKVMSKEIDAHQTFIYFEIDYNGVHRYLGIHKGEKFFLLSKEETYPGGEIFVFTQLFGKFYKQTEIKSFLDEDKSDYENDIYISRSDTTIKYFNTDFIPSP